MFFRRAKAQQATWDDRLQKLKEFGFVVESLGSSRSRVSKNGCAAVVEDRGDQLALAGKAGVIVGKEIGVMEHGGYQMFFRTPGGRRIPALAEHLRALHNFQEDLREALGMISLYNTSLGTTADRHMYDRVEDRDSDQPKKPWEIDVRQ